MKLVVALLSLPASLLADSASANCYMVYARDTLLYHSTQSPVDLAPPLSATVPARFGPDATMMFTSDSTYCPSIPFDRADLRAGAAQPLPPPGSIRRSGRASVAPRQPSAR